MDKVKIFKHTDVIQSEIMVILKMKTNEDERGKYVEY